MNMIFHHFDQFVGILSKHVLYVNKVIGTYYTVSSHFELLVLHGARTPSFRNHVRTFHFKIGICLSKFSFKQFLQFLFIGYYFKTLSGKRKDESFRTGILLSFETNITIETLSIEPVVPTLYS